MFYNFEKIVLTAARQKFSNMVQKPHIQFDEKKYQEERYFLIQRLRFFHCSFSYFSFDIEKVASR